METADAFSGTWAWFGREIAEFGVRWVVAALLALGFGGWFDKRYRDLKREVADLKQAMEAQSAAAVQADGSITIHGGVTITHNRFADGKHLVGIEGKGEIVSPTPIYVQALGAGVGPGAPEAIAEALSAEERWRASPGAGRPAAKLIAQASALEEAREIWDVYRSTPHRTDMAWAYWAFIRRLEEGGRGGEIPDLTHALYEAGEDIDPTDEIMATVKRWRDDDGR